MQEKLNLILTQGSHSHAVVSGVRLTQDSTCRATYGPLFTHEERPSTLRGRMGIDCGL
ncbi:MAG: hypothetical protein K2H38_06305 [Muribaculaceae bacterium]|nr:hypothetical protein [Muribaculaceae bacterium]